MPYTVSEVMTRMGDPSGTHWKTAEVEQAIDEEKQSWQALTGVFNLTYPVYTNSSSTVYYPYPTQILTPMRVSYVTSTTSKLTLTPISVFELDMSYPSWESDGVGVPRFWAVVGRDKLIVYPRPSTIPISTFQPYFAVTGPAELGVSHVDELEGGEDVRTLEYIHHILSFKESGEEFVATKEEYQKYLEAAIHKNGRLKAMMFYRRAMGLMRDETQVISRTVDAGVGVRSA